LWLPWLHRRTSPAMCLNVECVQLEPRWIHLFGLISVVTLPSLASVALAWGRRCRACRSSSRAHPLVDGQAPNLALATSLAKQECTSTSTRRLWWVPRMDTAGGITAAASASADRGRRVRWSIGRLCVRYLKVTTRVVGQSKASCTHNTFHTNGRCYYTVLCAHHNISLHGS
jgi:hypothetical protein